MHDSGERVKSVQSAANLTKWPCRVRVGNAISFSVKIVSQLCPRCVRAIVPSSRLQQKSLQWCPLQCQAPTAITAVKGRLACRLRAQIIIKPSSVWHWGDASQCCPELRFERVTVSRLLSAFIVCSAVRWFGFSDYHGQLQRRFRADKLRVLFRQAVLRFTPESVGGYRATWNWNRSSSSKILSGLMKIADRSWKVVTWD